MDKEKFLKIITYMGVVYNKEFTEEQVEIWYSFLKDYSVEELNNAVKYLINTEKFLPTIAHIKEVIAKSKLSEMPEAEEEWAKVINAVHVYGSYKEEEALNSLNEYTKQIVKLIGYYRICTSTQEEQTWNKKEFIAEYNALKDKLIVIKQIESNEKKMLNE